MLAACILKSLIASFKWKDERKEHFTTERQHLHTFLLQHIVIHYLLLKQYML